METNTKASTGQMALFFAVLAGIAIVGGLFGLLGYQIMEMSTGAPDEFSRNVLIVIGAALTVTVFLLILRKSAKQTKQRIEASGGSTSDLSFINLVMLGGMGDGGGSGSTSGSGGFWGGDGGGGFGGGDSGGCGGGGE